MLTFKGGVWWAQENLEVPGRELMLWPVLMNQERPV
jgi:hypothetical protein